MVLLDCLYIQTISCISSFWYFVLRGQFKQDLAVYWHTFFNFAFSACSSLPAFAACRLSCFVVNYKGEGEIRLVVMRGALWEKVSYF